MRWFILQKIISHNENIIIREKGVHDRELRKS